VSDRYRLFETERFQSDLQGIARAGHPKVVAKLREVVYPQLRQHPHFGPHVRKLKGFEPETWRFRIGAWRFFYEIDEQEEVVSLTGASHRGSAY
jgi:mRNA interferase RelE/StbE